MGNPSKDIPWMKIFDTYKIHEHDFSKSPYYISAKEIKSACQEFTRTAEKEVRILCYQAQRKDKPEIFNRLGLFLLPVKNGHYAIIKGEGYTEIPEITSEPILFYPEVNFTLESSEIGNSEMQYLDYAFASGMIEHFCEVGKLYLTIRGRKYTPSFDFKVGDTLIQQESVQTEVDAGYEGENHIVLIEGKSVKMKDTIIRQLYYPFRKWSLDTSKKVLPVFFEKSDNVSYKFWMYRFKNEQDYNSLELIKSATYIVAK